MNLDFLQLAKNHQTELLSDLFKLLEIPSIRNDQQAKPTMPFGPGPAKALEQFLRFAERDGFLSKNVDHYAGRISLGEGDELLGILVHLDVVPADEKWLSPPFKPEIRDNQLFARGAADDKGPAIAAYYALRILKDCNISFNRKIHLILGTDEECNWQCMEHYFKSEPMPDLGFSPDAEFPIINGEKGIVDVLIKTKTLSQKEESAHFVLTSFQAGKRANVVIDQAQACLKQKTNQEHQLVEQWQSFLKQNALVGDFSISDQIFTLICCGKTAHGAEPHKGINAATWLAAFLSRLELNQRSKNWLSWVSSFLHNAYDGHKLGIDSHDPIMGDLTINLGIMEWLDEQGNLVLNLRYPKSTSKSRCLEGLSASLKAYDLEISKIQSDKPVHYVDESDELVQTLLSVYHKQTGLPAKPLSIGGGTYARIMPRGVAFGAEFPGEDCMLHQANEHISIDSLIKATAIYAESIYRLTR